MIISSSITNDSLDVVRTIEYNLEQLEKVRSEYTPYYDLRDIDLADIYIHTQLRLQKLKTDHLGYLMDYDFRDDIAVDIIPSSYNAFLREITYDLPEDFRQAINLSGWYFTEHDVKEIRYLNGTLRNPVRGSVKVAILNYIDSYLIRLLNTGIAESILINLEKVVKALPELIAAYKVRQNIAELERKGTPNKDAPLLFEYDLNKDRQLGTISFIAKNREAIWYSDKRRDLYVVTYGYPRDLVAKVATDVATMEYNMPLSIKVDFGDEGTNNLYKTIRDNIKVDEIKHLSLKDVTITDINPNYILADVYNTMFISKKTTASIKGTDTQKFLDYLTRDGDPVTDIETVAEHDLFSVGNDLVLIPNPQIKNMVMEHLRKKHAAIYSKQEPQVDSEDLVSLADKLGVTVDVYKKPSIADFKEDIEFRPYYIFHTKLMSPAFLNKIKTILAQYGKTLRTDAELLPVDITDIEEDPITEEYFSSKIGKANIAYTPMAYRHLASAKYDIQLALLTAVEHHMPHSIIENLIAYIAVRYFQNNKGAAMAVARQLLINNNDMDIDHFNEGVQEFIRVYGLPDQGDEISALKEYVDSRFDKLLNGLIEHIDETVATLAKGLEKPISDIVDKIKAIDNEVKELKSSKSQDDKNIQMLTDSIDNIKKSIKDLKHDIYNNMLNMEKEVKSSIADVDLNTEMVKLKTNALDGAIGKIEKVSNDIYDKLETVAHFTGLTDIKAKTIKIDTKVDKEDKQVLKTKHKNKVLQEFQETMNKYSQMLKEEPTQEVNKEANIDPEPDKVVEDAQEPKNIVKEPQLDNGYSGVALDDNIYNSIANTNMDLEQYAKNTFNKYKDLIDTVSDPTRKQLLLQELKLAQQEHELSMQNMRNLTDKLKMFRAQE